MCKKTKNYISFLFFSLRSLCAQRSSAGLLLLLDPNNTVIIKSNSLINTFLLVQRSLIHIYICKDPEYFEQEGLYTMRVRLNIFFFSISPNHTFLLTLDICDCAPISLN